MKKKIQTGLPVFSSPSLRWLLPAFVVGCSSLASAAEAQPGAVEPKTHTLFMGADFSIEQDNKLYRVHDVVGSSFIITVNGREVSVPMDRGLSKFKIEPALKLTEASAAITNLKDERSYTMGNDPQVRLQRGLAQSEQMYVDSQTAQNQLNAGFHSSDPLTAAIGAAQRANAGSPGGLTTRTGQPNSAGAQFSRQSQQTVMAGPGTTYQSNVSTGEGAFDAMEVAFDVSSEKLLSHPYVVILVRYGVANGKPGEVGNWIYASSLQPIGREATKFHIEKGGLPPGFELQDFQVHLYDRGQEVATSISAKRVELTREEAFQYVMMEYVSGHKGDTLPATPAMGRLPADLPGKLANNEFQQTYYVKVTKDGKAAETFSDKSCSRVVDDPYLQSVIRGIRFKPALEKGRPVEGVASLKLGELQI